MQQNRIEDNRFGIWGRWGDAILLAANAFTNNAQGNFIQDVSNLVELPVNPSLQTSPTAEIIGPDVVPVGEAVRFYAATSREVPGRSLAFHWWMEGQASDQSIFEQTFSSPGFHRLGLTADNGALAGLAWRDLLVVKPGAHELGTEGQASRWGFELEKAVVIPKGSKLESVAYSYGCRFREKIRQDGGYGIIPESPLERRARRVEPRLWRPLPHPSSGQFPSGLKQGRWLRACAAGKMPL